MSEEGTITAHVEETGESVFSVDINVSGHSIKGDEPVVKGGANLGPNPYDLLTAALGECTAMTVRWYARRQQWPLEKVEVRITHSKQDEAPANGGKPRKVDVFEKQVILHGDALTDEQRAKLVDAAAKCPVQRTLESEIIIRTNA